MAPEPRIPDPEGLNAEFYARARDGRLHLQRCTACGRFRHPPRYFCGNCGSPEFSWERSSGRGQLFSWTITHTPFDRGWASELPYVTAVVELEEGVRLIGALDGITREQLEPGRPLQASLEQMGEEFVFLTFQPPRNQD
jgi:uncharacterized OB-fold protein